MDIKGVNRLSNKHDIINPTQFRFQKEVFATDAIIDISSSIVLNA